MPKVISKKCSTTKQKGNEVPKNLQRIDQMFRAVKKTATCPVCECEVVFTKMNEHIDSACLDHVEVLPCKDKSVMKRDIDKSEVRVSVPAVPEVIMLSDDEDFEESSVVRFKKRKLNDEVNEIKCNNETRKRIVNGKKNRTRKQVPLQSTQVTANEYTKLQNEEIKDSPQQNKRAKQPTAEQQPSTSKANVELLFSDSDDEFLADISARISHSTCEQQHKPSEQTSLVQPESKSDIENTSAASNHEITPDGALKRSKSLSPEKKSPGSLQNSRIISASQPVVTLGRNLYETSVEKTDDKLTHQINNQPYYLSNFNFIISEVLKDDFNTCLLDEEDLNWIGMFQGLPERCQKVYVRLFQRKYNWIRKHKIKYDNIAPDLTAELLQLKEAGLLMTGSENVTDLPTALRLLSAPEIQDLAKILRLSSSGGKGDIITATLSYAKKQRSLIPGEKDATATVLKKAQKLLGDCYKLSLPPRKTMVRLITLFCLPHHQEEDREGQQQLLMLLMVNLGKMQFPKSTIKREMKFYRNKEDLMRYECAIELENEMMECAENKDWAGAVEINANAKKEYKKYCKDKSLRAHDLTLPTFIRKFTAGWALVRVLHHGVEAMEKLKDYKSAVTQLKTILKQDAYLQHYRGRWYDRLALDLDQHLKKSEQAFHVIKEALADPVLLDTHRLMLSQRVTRICNRKRSCGVAELLNEVTLFQVDELDKVTIQGQKLSQFSKGSYKSVFMQKSNDGASNVTTLSSVEEFALGHYKANGYTEGMHAEGIFPTSMFGMFFWDVIYTTEVPDAFLSPFQSIPLDLNYPEFYTNRQKQIEERLAVMKEWTVEDAHIALDIVWSEHVGEASVVAWEVFHSVHDVKDIVACMGMKILCCLCEKMAKNFRHFRSGFPDLFIWNPNTEIFRIVEVKGPGDHLSHKQIIWLTFLKSIGAPAEVCHVEAVAGKKHRYRDQ